jgi:hypothetical protein
MNGSSTPRNCRCGTRLTRDNSSYQCAACQVEVRTLVMRPPDVPAGFCVTDHMQETLAAWNMGRVIAAYQSHPHHGRPMPPKIAAGRAGVTQAQLGEAIAVVTQTPAGRVRVIRALTVS